MFAAGDLVVYGGEGVCRVESVGTPDTSGYDKTKEYYTLAPLYRSGQVMTPVDTRVLMRPVMTAQEAADFLAALPQLPPEAPEGPGQRAAKDHYHAVVTSYDCGRMAAIAAAGRCSTAGRSASWTNGICAGRRINCTASWRRRWGSTGRRSAPTSSGTIPHGRRNNENKSGNFQGFAETKASLVQREVAARSADGGIVKKQLLSKQPLSHGIRRDSSPYTGEPLNERHIL